jgi:hypothetical protein
MRLLGSLYSWVAGSEYLEVSATQIEKDGPPDDTRWRSDATLPLGRGPFS